MDIAIVPHHQSPTGVLSHPVERRDAVASVPSLDDAHAERLAWVTPCMVIAFSLGMSIAMALR